MSKSISLSGLSPSQREAAETISGPVLILAGAGSGKTRTITYRMAHMISNLKMTSKDILGVTFTNKAAKEMKERVVSLVGRTAASEMTLLTFHALGVRILKNEISHLGYGRGFVIYDTSDQMAIIREALRKFKDNKSFDKKIVISKIGFLKNKGILPEEFMRSPYYDQENAYDLVTEHAYHFYQEKLKFYNAIDFDDILLLTVKLFQSFPDVAKKYSDTYKFIMVDEYQDTNPLQIEVIRGLTKNHNNICVVGDDDQSIYAFRGADIANILRFEKEFPGAKIIKLEENYRSTKHIIDLANMVIKENKERKDKTMFSRNTSGEKPLLWRMSDADHEAKTVVHEISKSIKAGKKLQDIAILYRSNTQTPVIEDELRMGRVPYKIIGGQKFYDKKEIKDLIAYLSLTFNSRDELSLRRVLNVPNRGIGPGTLKKYLTKMADEHCTLYTALKRDPNVDPKRGGLILSFTNMIDKYRTRFQNKEALHAVISDLIEEIDYYTFIDKSYDNKGHAEARKNDVSQFLESASRFQKQYGSDATLRNFLEKVLLADSQNDEKEEEENSDLTLMTLHSSKGLEFDEVYLIGMEENLLPHKRSIADGDIAEERRLCYVGMTRAKKKLIMTYCKERKLYGKMVPTHPSRFVLKLEKFISQEDRTTFGYMTETEEKQYKNSVLGSLLDGLD